MTFTVAPCADLEEFGQAVFAIGQYFALDPTSERMERFSKNLPIERMHAAREKGTIVGGAGAFPFEMTVPGGTVPTAGVTVVGTFPTHRRRGVLRSMMRAQLDDVHEREEPVALLWASEETIYGRFGYGMASFAGEVELAREYSAFARPLAPEGRLRIVDADEAAQLFPKVWNAVRRRTPGMLSRTSNWWQLRILFEVPGQEGGPKRFVVLERDGRPEGYAVYRHKPKWDGGVSASELEVVEAVALDGRATAEIWRYLFDIDWAAQDHRVPLAGRPSAVLPAREPAADAVPHLRRDLGAARGRRRCALGARLCGRRRRGLRRGRRFLPVERRPAGAWRTASRSGRAPRPSSAATSRRSAPRTSGRSASPSSSAADGSRSFDAAPQRARTRCSPRSALRGVPRSSSSANRRLDVHVTLLRRQRDGLAVGRLRLAHPVDEHIRDPLAGREP